MPLSENNWLSEALERERKIYLKELELKVLELKVLEKAECRLV